MKVSYISDLHLDFHVKYGSNEDKMFKKTREFIEKLIQSDVGDKEVIVIAGDLSHYNKQSIAALEVFNEHYELVLFVPGNHDYYLVSKTQCYVKNIFGDYITTSPKYKMVGLKKLNRLSHNNNWVQQRTEPYAV